MFFPKMDSVIFGSSYHNDIEVLIILVSQSLQLNPELSRKRLSAAVWLAVFVWDELIN